MKTLSYYAVPGVAQAPAERKTPEGIKAAILKYLKMEDSEINTRWRHRQVAYARQLISYFLKERTRLSFKEITAFIYVQNHTSVIHAIKTLHDLIDTDPAVRADVAALGEIV